jgi:hypothetical protein
MDGYGNPENDSNEYRKATEADVNAAIEMSYAYIMENEAGDSL